MFFTRREVLAMIASVPAALAAQGPSQLPLKTSGLEHIGFTAPDPQRSAAFYGRIFDPQIFQEMNPLIRVGLRLGNRDGTAPPTILGSSGLASTCMPRSFSRSTNRSPSSSSSWRRLADGRAGGAG